MKCNREIWRELETTFGKNYIKRYAGQVPDKKLCALYNILSLPQLVHYY